MRKIQMKLMVIMQLILAMIAPEKTIHQRKVSLVVEAEKNSR